MVASPSGSGGGKEAAGETGEGNGATGEGLTGLREEADGVDGRAVPFFVPAAQQLACGHPFSKLNYCTHFSGNSIRGAYAPTEKTFF
jgi:hypothetical protein